MQSCNARQTLRLGVETTSMSSSKRLHIIFHTHGRMGMATSTFQSLSLAETHFLHLPLVPSACLCESAWPTATHNRATIPFRCAAQPSHETRPRTTPHHGSSFPPSSCSLVSLQHGSTPSPTLPSPHSVTHRVSPLPPSSKGLRTVQPLPASDKARQCPSRLA
jgi:hypothetical protein